MHLFSARHFHGFNFVVLRKRMVAINQEQTPVFGFLRGRRRKGNLCAGLWGRRIVQQGCKIFLLWF